jgi:SHS2 domain-containing protein
MVRALRRPAARRQRPAFSRLSTVYCLLSTLSFSFFDHTGDIGVRLSGRTLDELFESAAAAFVDSITDPARIEPRRPIWVELESAALDLLLVDFLNEILYRFEVQQFLVAAAQVQVERVGTSSEVRRPASDVESEPTWRLHATLSGEPFDRERHGIKVLIKAVTYHALEVRQTDAGWEATVVFDI